MMLTGIDLSHHNKNMKDPFCICKYDFVILKASEGMGFRDNYMRTYIKILKEGKRTPLLGFYHFARPEINNDPYCEARNFIEAVRPFMDMMPLLALDVEGRSLTEPFIDVWARTFCEYVIKELKIKPMLYTSASALKLFPLCEAFGCGLWVAKWSDKISKKDVKPWDFWAIWQNSSSYILSGVRVDTDVFNGTREQFLKYAEVLSDGKENDTASNDSGHRRTDKEK